MLEHVVFGMHFFGVFSVSVDDAFWSVFLIFDANLTHLIYNEWEIGSFVCALAFTLFSGITGGAYCRWRCCFSVFLMKWLLNLYRPFWVFLWNIALQASSVRCDQPIRFVGFRRFDFREWSSRCLLEYFLIPIQKSSRWSLSKVEPVNAKLLRKSWHFFEVWTAKGVVNAWT